MQEEKMKKTSFCKKFAICLFNKYLLFFLLFIAVITVICREACIRFVFEDYIRTSAKDSAFLYYSANKLIFYTKSMNDQKIQNMATRYGASVKEYNSVGNSHIDLFLYPKGISKYEEDYITIFNEKMASLIKDTAPIGEHQVPNEEKGKH